MHKGKKAVPPPRDVRSSHSLKRRPPSTCSDAPSLSREECDGAAVFVFVFFARMQPSLRGREDLGLGGFLRLAGD